MTKVLTRNIQSELVQLGETLGFESKLEYSFTKIDGQYAPRYDVVWLLDIRELQADKIQPTILVEDYYVPFAAFEVEGSTTSSKNQLGNVGNLRMSPCYYNFIVVNNAAAAGENDTYRRGMKIVRTMQEMMGERPFFFLDSSMLMDLPSFTKTNLSVIAGDSTRKKGSGGETLSLSIAEKVIQKLLKTKLQIDYDRTPDYFKHAFHVKKRNLISSNYTYEPIVFTQKKINTNQSYYYKPKIDIAAGFNVTGGFVDFLRECAKRLQTDAIHFPLLQYVYDIDPEMLYHPLLGIEIEMKESKHALGGVMNISNFYQNGWLVGPPEMEAYVETYKAHLGMKNVHFINCEEL